jgi:hypothetical protein
MICHNCAHYRPMSQSRPITAACEWRPSPDELDQLRALLPAAALSRALVQSAPHQVEACGTFTADGDSP